MSNEKMFYKLCNIMSKLEDSINAIENLGFVVEPGEEGTVSNNLYISASTAYDIAISLLDCPDNQIENNIANDLLTANSETMKEISKTIWSEYGIK